VIINFVLPFLDQRPSGGYRIVYEYANRLSERGHDVVIYYPLITPSDDRDKEMLMKKLFYCIRTSFPQEFDSDWFKFSGNVRQFGVPEISDMHLRDSDVIIATAWTTSYLINNLAATKGIKYYLIQHHESLNMSSPGIVDKTYSLGLNNIVISMWLKNLLNSIGAPVAAHIPNGIDLHVFSARKPINNRNPLSIAMMYHLSSWKGIQDGIAALVIVKHKYPNLKVSFFGAFEKEADVPDWVQYFYCPSRSDLCNIYNEHAIFMSPSWSEGFGLPGAEAMACGCALVTTDNSGVRDYAQHEQTALLSKPKGHPKELAANIIYLLENNDFRIAIAERGRQYIQRFTWDSAVLQMEQLIGRGAK